MIKLGDRVRDTISGYEGIVTARSAYLNGCVSFCVAAEKLNKDGAVPDAVWFDEQRIVLCKAAADSPQPAVATAGGPQPRPPKDGAR